MKGGRASGDEFLSHIVNLCDARSLLLNTRFRITEIARGAPASLGMGMCELCVMQEVVDVPLIRAGVVRIALLVGFLNREMADVPRIRIAFEFVSNLNNTRTKVRGMKTRFPRTPSQVV